MSFLFAELDAKDRARRHSLRHLVRCGNCTHRSCRIVSVQTGAGRARNHWYADDHCWYSSD